MEIKSLADFEEYLKTLHEGVNTLIHLHAVPSTSALFGFLCSAEFCLSLALSNLDGLNQNAL